MQISQLGEKYKVINVINTAYKCGGNSLNAVVYPLKIVLILCTRTLETITVTMRFLSAMSRILMTS